MSKNNQVNFTVNKQQGFTLWSFLFVAGVLIFVFYIGAKLIPVYSADVAIKKALDASLDGVTREQVRKKEIIKSIDRKLYVDGIYEGPDMKEAVNVKKQKKGTTVTVEYKEEVPLFYNIGIYLDFKHLVEK